MTGAGLPAPQPDQSLAPKALRVAVVEQVEMADGPLRAIGGMQQRNRALGAGIIAERATDRRHAPQLVIRNRDRKESRARHLLSFSAMVS